MIDRPLYMDRLARWRDRDVIKVVTGVRRCGKSTLLRLFSDRLRAEGIPEDRIITINLEQLENEKLLDYRKLHEEIVSRITSKETHYVFIDEVQNVPEFQRAVDSLYARDGIDLYITGSNALLLEGTLATLLSGRYVEVKMLPLSFSEFASTAPQGQSLERTYGDYISHGSFPATIGFRADQLALHDYLEGILNTVLFKDVAQKLNVSNTIALDALVSFVYDNIGNLTSAKGISGALETSGVRISPNTVSEYLSALVNSFVAYRAKRFDIKGKRLLKLQEKYYGVDMGLRRMLLSNQVRDRGRILENVVFLELQRRFGTAYVGQVSSREVDFVVPAPDGLRYYQVAETVRDDATLGRELESLRAIRDNNPKFLLTLDDEMPVLHDGIKQVNALEWLMEEY